MLRRWVDAGRLVAKRSDGNQRLIDGPELARFAVELTDSTDPEDTAALSARNRFTGLITRVVADKVMAQVELQSGPHRIVALISSEAVDDLGLEPGVMASAVVKATNVVIERDDR